MSLLEFMQILHNLGLVWGVGGATMSSLIMFKAEKDPQAAPYLMRLIPTISKLIGAGFILLLVSGIVLTRLTRGPIDPQILIAKHITVVMLVLVAVILIYLTKKGENLKKGDKLSKELLSLQKKAKIAGIINLALWYMILGLSVVM